MGHVGGPDGENHEAVGAVLYSMDGSLEGEEEGQAGDVDEAVAETMERVGVEYDASDSLVAWTAQPHCFVALAEVALQLPVVGLGPRVALTEFCLPVEDAQFGTDIPWAEQLLGLEHRLLSTLDRTTETCKCVEWSERR